MTDMIAKSDVEQMIKEWQSECANHPALHNQANVLLDRLNGVATADVDLLPCPFCGGTAHRFAPDKFKNVTVRCNECGAQTSPILDHKGAVKSATDAWNRRTTNAPGAPQHRTSSEYDRQKDIEAEGQRAALFHHGKGASQ